MKENTEANIDNLLQQTEISAQLADILDKTDKAVLIKMIETLSFAIATNDDSVNSPDELLQLANANTLGMFFSSYIRITGSLPDADLLEGLNP